MTHFFQFSQIDSDNIDYIYRKYVDLGTLNKCRFLTPRLGGGPVSLEKSVVSFTGRQTGGLTLFKEMQ